MILPNLKYPDLMLFLLRAHPLSPAFQRALDEVTDTVEVSKGEIIVFKNKAVTFYAYFKSGYAMAYTVRNGKTSVQRFYVPESLLMPGKAPLGDSKADETVLALSPCVLYTLDLARLKALTNAFEEARILLSDFQGEKIEEKRKRADSLAHDDAQTRLDLFRLDHPAELLQHLPNRPALASYLGMDISTLNRLEWPLLEELRAKYASKAHAIHLK